MTASTSMRLHITPLNENLLPTVLGPILAKAAENISFHSIETFPENDYAFIDLPEADAKTLISKLNGAILKGKKMKVEKARPKKRSRDVVEEEEGSTLVPDQSQKKARRPKKDTEDGVLAGHLLPTDRKVKRGWTEAKSEESARSASKDKKKKKKSKRQAPSQYTEKEELLFRTKLPPNKEHLDTGTKAKDEKEKKKKRNTETVVHEFRRTDIQPAFIRDTAQSSRAAEYVDHVGWVNGKGEVIEEAPSSVSQTTPHTAEGLRIAIPIPNGAKTVDKQSVPPVSTPTDDTSGSSTSDDRVDSNLQEDATSHSDSSSSTSGPDLNAESSEEAESEEEEEEEEEAHNTSQDHGHANLETPQKVHPLEALFKKPKTAVGQEVAKPSLEIETSFSFFDQSAADGDDELPPMPATPFTSHDLRSREIRSAAPTPDTAHPSRFSSFANALANRATREQVSDEAAQEVVGNKSDVPVPASERASGERTQSDFEKRFWAERGQNNRAWKTRRKTALKEQRQKDNRQRRPRNW